MIIVENGMFLFNRPTWLISKYQPYALRSYIKGMIYIWDKTNAYLKTIEWHVSKEGLRYNYWDILTGSYYRIKFTKTNLILVIFYFILLVETDVTTMSQLTAEVIPVWTWESVCTELALRITRTGIANYDFTTGAFHADVYLFGVTRFTACHCRIYEITRVVVPHNL